MVDLAERLDSAMKDRGVSVSQLATAVGVSYQAIKKIVDGKTHTLKGANLLKISGYLKVGPEWLGTGAGPREVITTNFDSAMDKASRTVGESEWALLEDFNMLPDDEKAALRATLKAKADHVRKIVNDYLGKRGISATPATDSRVEETYGAPPPPPTGVGSYKRVGPPVPEAPKPPAAYPRKVKRT